MPASPLVTRRKSFAALAAAGIAAGIAACLATTPALADGVTVQSARGPVDLPANPQRIVAMDVAVMDTLSALGVQPVGVVSPHFVDYLDEEVAAATVVGTLFEPDFEKIAALGPDLIVIATRSSTQGEPLSKIGPVVDMTIGYDALNEGLDRLRDYGALTGTSDKAEELAAELLAKADEAKALIKDSGDMLIVMTNGPKLSVFGGGSRFGWLHAALDWPEAAEGLEATPHGEVVTFEYLAETDPDTMIVIDRAKAIGGGAQTAEATLDNELVHGTKAWKSGRVIHLSPTAMYIAAGGVQSLNKTLDELIAALKTDS